MKALKLITIFIIIISISFAMLTPASAVDLPDVSAKSVLLLEADTNTVLFAENENERVYPASTTKIMTVFLAAEAISEGRVSGDDVVTVSESALSGLASDGSTAEITAGEELTLYELMYCALLVSANEACNAIAEHVAGDISSFVDMMNAKVSSFGCTGTHFANTHGLYDDDHYTTASDLALIIKNAMSNTEFAKIAGTENYLIPSTNKSTPRHLTTTDELLKESSRYYYKYCTAGKTGYLDKAGYCLVSMAENDSMTLISVVMDASSKNDVSGSDMRFSYARTLFDWGFSNYSFQTLLETSNLLREVPVAMADGTDSVLLKPKSSVTALLPNDFDSENIKYDITVYNEENGQELTAPISSGKELGEVSVYYGDQLYGTVKLVASTNITLKKSEFIKSQLKKIFTSAPAIIIILALVAIIVLYILYLINYNRHHNENKSIFMTGRKNRSAPEKSDDQITATTGMSFEQIEEHMAQNTDKK